MLPAGGTRAAAAGRPGAGARGSVVTATADAVQLLTTAGELVAHPEYPIEASVADLRALYRGLVLVRRLDAEATALQRQGELALWAPLYGQEAAQIGSAHALAPDDMVFPSYREHAVAWHRGVPLQEIIAPSRGVRLGGWDTAAHGMQNYAIVLGAQTLHATGYALGVQRDGAATAVLTYLGDGAMSQGDVSEAFTFAAVAGAPVVFFCQNNQWAISTPVARQSRVPLYRRAQGFGFPGVRVDGNDVLAVRAVTAAALHRAREGGGPTLIEAVTYRMGPHTTSDDPGRYRPPGEAEHWRTRDPIARIRAWLTRASDDAEAFFAAVELDAADLAARLREACMTMPDPDPASLFEHVYADGHAGLDEQRRVFLERRCGGR
ncbi:pyruvate dehydrogenase (acetyl-transferring) E1 component subunit alpha [Dactylosporangium sp. CA-139114]|uniref:pyruvate dehydrogenase (acetyl-transferring) E1 component subunit alpha n=1 Tax=Dactylosporangium sp. CA-139114 TaxID=3239931 RepID=UPI003D958CED